MASMKKDAVTLSPRKNGLSRAARELLSRVSLLAELRRPDPAEQTGIEFGRCDGLVLEQGSERNTP
jgi:hypothetical protein